MIFSPDFTPHGTPVPRDLLRRWLHERNRLRQEAPNPMWKHLHDLDALGPLMRHATWHEQRRIEQIEVRHLARLNQVREA